MTALTLPVLLTTEPTRFDGIHALLLAPLVLMLIAAFVIGVAYASSLLDRLVRLVDRLIDRGIPNRPDPQGGEVSENYKPGTVAEATVCGVPGVRVFRRYNQTGGDWAFTPEPERGIHYSCAGDREGLVTDIRPQIVLLPAATKVARDLVKEVREAARKSNDCGSLLHSLADDIEAQALPAEPRGLGAVVEDAKGTRWIRTHNNGEAHWREAEFEGIYRAYADIDAVRVLSEGVEVDR